MQLSEIMTVFEGYKKKSVLVTGGTGLVGRQVVNLLVENGADVTVVSLDKISSHLKAKLVFGDLTDLNFCKKITQGVDYLFHIAGIKGSIEVTKKKPASFFVPLLMMNTNILESARANGVKRTVYTSSIGAYESAEIFKESDNNQEGPPMDEFPGWAKRMAELQVKAYQIQYGLDNFAVVRLCNVYGPGDNFDPNNAMVIPSLMSRIRKGENPLLIWGDGKAVRDFAYSEDVARGILLALEHGTRGRYVNLGSGKGITVKELVETLKTVTPFEYQFDTTKSSGFPKRVMDVSRAKEWLGYEPRTSLKDGLQKTWQWYLENEKEYLNKQNYFVETAKNG